MKPVVFNDPELLLSHKCGSVQIDVHHYQTTKPTVRDWWRITITMFGDDNTYFLFDKQEDAKRFLIDLQNVIDEVDIGDDWDGKGNMARCSVCERKVEKGEDIIVNTETGDIKCSRCWVHSL